MSGVLAGVAPWILNAPLSAAAAAILNTPADFSLAVWHGLSPTLMLSGLTLLGVALAYMARDVIRGRAWRPAHGTEQLYTGALAALNAISHVIAPPLHSASLRSYVMVIVVTTIVVVGTALVAVPGFGAFAPEMNVQPHEFLIVVVIIAGAIAATLAKSTMAAVLSLGVVGYGVATTFLLFGAPDLAMTQFSVETLTVVIYVLVFRHFRNLGALSPRLVRYRDACIAAGIGTLIGGLVLSVSTTETAPRLREYFAEFGPTLGHGRNIVNVILVDFRGVRHDGRDHRAGDRRDRCARAAAAGGRRASRRGIATGTAADVADLSHRRSPADAAASALCRLPAAARPQRTWRRIRRRPGGGGGIRAVRDCLRRRSCATGTAGQTADADWRRAC